jgi:mRNA interferase RelE/StbE
MSYEVIIPPKAKKTLRKLQPKRRQQILQKLEALAKDPYAPNNNVKALTGSPYYRLRVADYRILYELHDGKLQLLVIEIGTRGDIYQ